MASKVIQSRAQFFEETGGSLADYYAQFKTAKPELGKFYRCQTLDHWSVYEIVYVGRGVALGVEVVNGRHLFDGPAKHLFTADGPRAGWREGDNRPASRLVQEVKPTGIRS